MRSALVACGLAAVLAGCGGHHGSRAGQSTATPPRGASPPARSVPTTPEDPGLPKPLRLPSRVPNRATGPGDPATARVVRRWTAALRRGHIREAARLFALPSRVQNGTPVLTLRTDVARIAFNAGFPCGATVRHVASAGRYAIVTFTLTERVGGDCMGAAGRLARSAIRVRRGRMVEWYRLRDPRRQPAPAHAGVDPGNNEA